jgi:hypothetical protein
MKTTRKRTTSRRAASGQMSLNFEGVGAPVRHAKRTRKAARTTEARKTISRAKRIYDAQKKDFSEDFKLNIKMGYKPTTAAKKAGESYRKAYGATRTSRWKHALKEASRRG